MDAKEFLRQGFRLNELIESDLSELRRLRELSTSLSDAGYGRERVRGGGQEASRLEAVVVKIVDLEREIDREIDSYVDLQAAIRRAIDALPDLKERLVLRYRYIEFMSWAEVQGKMGLEESQVFALHRRALKGVRAPA